MRGFLLDTHVWFWYLRANARLPRGIRRVIDASIGDCWLSPISIWELGLLHSRGRIRLDTPLRPWVRDALDALPLTTAVVTNDVALAASEIPIDVRDPSDRFIAASAMTYELTLMTVDEDLVRADWLETTSG